MSGREWKPGDVALIPFSGRRVRAMWVAEKGWVLSDGRGGARAFADVRPLVVLDYTERDLRDLLHVLGVAACEFSNEGANLSLAVLDRLRDELREHGKPPKPEEPSGRYAVVEDEGAVEWVRADTVGLQQWHSIEGRESRWADWDDITVVKVLSPGVSS